MQDSQTVASADSNEGDTTVPGRLNTAARSLFGATGLVRFLLIVVVLAVFLGVFAVIDRVGSEELSEGALFDVPKDWTFQWDAIKAVDGVVEWVVVNWGAFFEGIRIGVLAILIPFRDFLGWLPWWFVVAGTGLVAWRMVGRRFGIVVLGFLTYMTVLNYIPLAMLTLAITLTAAMICVALGIPLGIATAKSDRFERVIRPVLDAMQTLPSFVYLIPAIMLFKMGMTPAVMATVIYSIPPIIRLTGLGIRQVDAQVIEAGKSFGSTGWQLLTKVQVPLAMPTILAGLNQTIMMALAMVVIASMIGAKGMGVEVLNGITRLEPGRGILAGAGIVFMAIILDRMSQAIAARGPETRPAS